ncbi:proton-coupled zinc antiporter SLC30A2-like isoform X3 [Dermacentor variabilis]|uniref:proton-coupled zinc antiporter SLC30A2-like isoform X3 n=1 Tax=Dermacentor variabilis TaxID=34621 RepID=UPI003F5C341B
MKLLHTLQEYVGTSAPNPPHVAMVADDEKVLLKHQPTATLGTAGAPRHYESIVNAGSSIIYCSARGDRDEPGAGQPSVHIPVNSGSQRNQVRFVFCPKAVRRHSPATMTAASQEEHCHSPDGVEVDHLARKKLIFASILCLVFMILEIVGGLLANSLAVATDAAHLLTDFASFMISLFSIWLAHRPPTKRMSFGWYRAEVIGAVTSVLLIWVVTGVLVYMAVQRIVLQEYEINATIMLITAGIGILVNIIMGVALQVGGVPHGHSHGAHHAADDDDAHLKDRANGVAVLENGGSRPGSAGTGGRGSGNINVRAALIHVIGDFLQSLGVFVAALIIFFRPDYRIADPLCTFLFSVLVLLSTMAILREALTVLMEGKPSGIDFREVLTLLAQQPGVHMVHNLRIWALSMDKIALSAHIVIRPNEDAMQVLKSCSRMIRSNYDIFELTLQIEEYHEVMDDCAKCNDLRN